VADAAEPAVRVAGRAPADAGHGDRRADRLAVLDDHAQGPAAQIRPEYLGVDPVDRIVYEPGEITQCDL
jgi:hypothetical protein